MALRWFLNSAMVSQVLGHPESLKDTKEVVSQKDKRQNIGFQMPLHYPRYSKAEYEKMEEWKVDMVLREYGLSFKGTLEEKRAFAMGAFLWPNQL